MKRKRRTFIPGKNTRMTAIASSIDQGQDHCLEDHLDRMG